MELLSSPDQLDQAITITSPIGWIAMLTLGLLALLLAVWSVTGRIPTTINGGGILLSGGKLLQVVAQGDGQIADILVRIGDTIQAGQTVGHIRQPELDVQLASQSGLVAKISTNLAEVTASQNKELKQQLNYYAEYRATLKENIADNQQQVDSLRRIVDAQQQLMDTGLITETTLLQTRGQFNSARMSLLDAQNKLLQITAQETQARSTAQEAIFSTELSYLLALQQFDDYRVRHTISSELVSPYGGRVVDIVALEGQTVSRNSPVIMIEDTDQNMSAVIFYMAKQGKKAKVGMDACVSPSTATAEEYGFMRGRVTFVSDVPCSKASMNALLQNDNLVALFSMAGAPVRIDIQLVRDAANRSGYQWSSSHGPPFRITPGTVCSTQIIVQEAPPITLVIPFLKRLFGIED